MKKIEKNSVKCNKCGDILTSVEDGILITCKCGAIAIDGGHNFLKRYFRQGLNGDDYVELSEWEQKEENDD